MLRHALFFTASGRGTPAAYGLVSYLGAARFTVIVFRAPCAGPAFALGPARGVPRARRCGVRPRGYILDTRRLCQNFSRVPPSPTGTSTGT